MKEREGLIARIRQIRRVGIAPERRAPTAPPAPGGDRADELETRIRHLEQLVQGLQDSVYRESERHAKLIGELQEQVRPSTMNAALNKDARERGLG
jgi:hypothetical protein